MSSREKNKGWEPGSGTLSGDLVVPLATLRQVLGEEPIDSFIGEEEFVIRLSGAIHRACDRVVSQRRELEKAERTNDLLRTDLHSANAEADRLRKLLRIIRRVTKLAKS